MTITCKKGAQNFQRAFSKVFDRVKSVAPWSTKKKKEKKRTIKGYGPAARNMTTCIILNNPRGNVASNKIDSTGGQNTTTLQSIMTCILSVR